MGFGGFLAQVLLGAGGNQYFFTASAVFQNEGFQGWASISSAWGRLNPAADVFLW